MTLEHTVFSIFVNVNRVRPVIAVDMIRRMSLEEMQTVVDSHKRTAVDRILNAVPDNEPTASEWEQFLTNTNL